MKVMFFINSGRRCAASVFVLVGLVTLTGTTTMNVEGKSSAYCKKNTGYNCGAVFPPDSNKCSGKGCCCHQEDGEGYKLNTCDNAKGYAYRGCNSCWGVDTCFNTNNVNIGDSSCHGDYACNSLSDSTIYNDSCQGVKTCYGVKDSTINEGSCQSKESCRYVQNSTIHDGSCQGYQSCKTVKNSIIGKGSCTGINGNSCDHSENITIGNNSCNGGLTKNNTATNVCEKCAHNVPNNACNQGSTDDMTDGYCNFCVGTQGVVSYDATQGVVSYDATQGVVSSSTSKNKKSKSNKKQAVGPSKK